VRHRYGCARETWRRWTGICLGGYSLVAAGLVWMYFPWKPTAILLPLLLAGLLIANQQFYVFLAAERGIVFTLAAIPFHLLYFFSNAVAFLIELTKFKVGQLLGLESSRRRPAGEANRKTKTTVR